MRFITDHDKTEPSFMPGAAGSWERAKQTFTFKIKVKAKSEPRLIITIIPHEMCRSAHKSTMVEIFRIVFLMTLAVASNASDRQLLGNSVAVRIMS